VTIVFPIGSFYPAQLGGPSNTIYWLARAIHEKGHNVFVGTTNHGLEHYKIKINQWLKNECGNVLYQKTLLHYFPITLMIRLIPILKNADIVHLTSLFYPPSWLIASGIVLLSGKSQIVWSVRGELNDNALSFSSWRKKIMLFWIKKVFRKRVIFHSTSNSETANLYEKLGRDIRVIEHPNYMYLSSKLDEPIAKTILYLGRIHPIKGLENLIRAFANINDRKEFKLVIAGNDNNSYADELKQVCKKLKIENNIHFYGKVEGIKKEKLISSSYLLVLPSITENFGNVVVEALAQGTPVIASQNTPWEVLDSIKAGSWFHNDPESLRGALEMMINCDKHEYENIRLRAYDMCKNNFSILENIKDWEASYAEIANP